MNPAHRSLPPTALLVGAMACALVLLAQAEESTKRPFDLPGGAAVTTLRQFADRSGHEVLFVVEVVRGARTNPVRGEFTAREALQHMLAGTGLQAVRDELTGAFAVRRLPAPASAAPRAQRARTPPRPRVSASPDPTRAGAVADSRAKPAVPAGVKTRKNPLARMLGWIATAVAPAQASDASSSAPHRGGSPASGGIAGRVFNPATGAYVRHAEVRVQGTNLTTLTGLDGSYRFSSVPVGAATVVVRFIGYQPATAAVEVRTGRVAMQDFELHGRSGTDVVTLDQLTVSAAREGTAKALMEQRAALTIKNVISSDTFGDMIEGNIGEVLQFLPGIEVTYSGADPSTLNMRGLSGEYGALMIDGVRTPSGTLNGSRAPELAVYSANGMETIEYNKTSSADMDADAPAGSVNMKSKSAFQRRGRFLGFQAYALLNSLQLQLGKSNGPNDGEMHKTLPGASLDYSDTLWRGRLGVVLNVSDVSSSNDQAGVSFSYHAAPTAGHPEPVVLTNISYLNGAKVNRRQSGALNLEYKVSPSLGVALRAQFNTEDVKIFNRQFAMVTNRANLAPGSNAVVMIANPTTNNATRFQMAGSHSYRTRNNHTLAPSITYTGVRLTADATFAFSRAGQVMQNGRLNGRRPSLNAANLQLFRVGFTARRHTGVDDVPVTFHQTSGPDLYNLRNWLETSAAYNLTKVPTEPRTRSILTQGNVEYRAAWAVPTSYRFTDDLMGIVSFNQSIKREALVNLTGVATINEDNLTGVMPNLRLKPEYADNYAARLEYYFEPVGVLSAGVYRMDVKNLHQTATVAAEEIGLGGEYPGYFFSTTTNRDRIEIEGFEFEYRQQLTFLPGILRGLGVFGNYARSRYSDTAAQYGVAPKIGSAGVSFRYKRLSAALRAAWRSDLMLNATTMREERTHVSTTVDYEWSRRVTFFIAGRNIFNAPLFQYSSTLPRHLTQFRTYGANWTVGVKTKL